MNFLSWVTRGLILSSPTQTRKKNRFVSHENQSYKALQSYYIVASCIAFHLLIHLMALGHVPIHPGARRLLRLEVSPGSFKAAEPGIQTIQEFLPVLLRLENGTCWERWGWCTTMNMRCDKSCEVSIFLSFLYGNYIIIISSYEYTLYTYASPGFNTYQQVSRGQNLSKTSQNRVYEIISPCLT